MSARIYFRTELTGDVSGSLQNIDGQLVADGDACIVVVYDEQAAKVITYFHKLSADSGAAHNPPEVVEPLINAGTKRWILAEVFGAVEGGGGGIADLSGFTTDDLSEGATHLYHTVERVQAVFPNTNSLTEGSTNLYHTTARVETVVINMNVLIPDSVTHKVPIQEIDLPTLAQYKVNGIGLDTIINQMIDAKI